MISVVCPFYNEEDIIEASVTNMLDNLQSLPEDWELIIVNDGSTDGSLEIAQNLEQKHPNLRVVSYPHNRGRGYALRTGVAEACGDIVVTTEIDGSWGDNIAHRIYKAFQEHPDADIIVASPHLKGGGYKNVPLKRVLLSGWGNYIIRAGLTYEVTMNTGMTRGYRREKFLDLPLSENDKEMHLEVINKALAFGYNIYEIPAVLEWKTHKLEKAKKKSRKEKRKSSTKIAKTIRTHLLFSAVVSPFRYIFPISILITILGLGFVVLAVYNLFNPEPSAFFLITGLLLFLFSFLLFSMAVLGQQNRHLQREIWDLQRLIRKQAREKT